MTSSSILVDVVIPVYNRERTIGRAIRSVLGQTHHNLRLIVVDDGSTDGTVEVVRSFSDERLVLLEQAHGGVGTARNTGAAAGLGTHLIFLDSDDVAHPDWLDALLAVDDKAAIVSCAARFVVPGEAEVTKGPYQLGPEFHRTQAHFLPGCFLLRRDVFERIGGYAVDLAFSENTELGFRMTDAAVEMGLHIRSSDRPLLVIHQPRKGRSQAAKPEHLLNSAKYFLARYEQRIAANPALLASCHAIAGVNSLRMGERRAARVHLQAAVRLKPRALRYWARLAQAWLPFSTTWVTDK